MESDSCLKSVYTEVDGLRMHARISGNPTEGQLVPIILVHGIGVSSRYMVPLACTLAPEFKVYAPDLPGFGKSDKPPKALDVPGLAGFLHSWMVEMSLPRAIVIGNSFGCQIGIELALRHPECVERLILIGPTADPSLRNAFTMIWRLAVDATREPISLLPLAVRDYLIAGPVRMIQSFRHLLAYRTEKRLPQISVPVLSLAGSRDPIVTNRWVKRVAQIVPDGRHLVIPDVSHAVNYSAPATLVEAIRPFLSECAHERGGMDQG